jgi:RimJ/RimL family protein N-acetyltransferase
VAVPGPTDRLTFREVTPDDLDLVVSQLGDPRVMWMVPAPYTREQCRALIDDSLSSCRDLGYGAYLLFSRESGDFVGECGLNPVAVEGAPEVEIGYNVRPELWGRGLASEAGLACLEFARTIVQLPRVIALIDPRNERSMRTAARIGMAFEREATARDKRYALWAVNW